MCAWLTPTCFPGRCLSSGRASQRCQVKVAFLPCLLRDPRPPFPELSCSLWCLTVKHLGPEEGMWAGLIARSEGKRHAWCRVLAGQPSEMWWQASDSSTQSQNKRFLKGGVPWLRVKNLPAMQETWVGSWDGTTPWRMVPHSCVLLAWSISWTEEPDKL